MLNGDAAATRRAIADGIDVNEANAVRLSTPNDIMRRHRRCRDDVRAIAKEGGLGWGGARRHTRMLVQQGETSLYIAAK